MQPNELNLRQLWEQTLGAPPMPEQFGLWSALHTEEVVRQSILRTARKNIELNGTMTQEHKVKFASKVMLTQTARNAANAANRAALAAEMETENRGNR